MTTALDKSPDTLEHTKEVSVVKEKTKGKLNLDEIESPAKAAVEGLF